MNKRITGDTGDNSNKINGVIEAKKTILGKFFFQNSRISF